MRHAPLSARRHQPLERPRNRVGGTYAAVNLAMVGLAVAMAEDGLCETELDRAFECWQDRLAAVSATRPGS